MTEVGKRTLDPRVAPLRILARHPHHEVSDLSERRGAASTSSRAAVVLLGDQPPVPAKNRVRSDDAGHLHQRAPAKLLAAHRESTALVVCEPKRSRTLHKAPARLAPRGPSEDSDVDGNPSPCRDSYQSGTLLWRPASACATLPLACRRGGPQVPPRCELASPQTIRLAPTECLAHGCRDAYALRSDRCYSFSFACTPPLGAPESATATRRITSRPSSPTSSRKRFRTFASNRSHVCIPRSSLATTPSRTSARRERSPTMSSTSRRSLSRTSSRKPKARSFRRACGSGSSPMYTTMNCRTSCGRKKCSRSGAGWPTSPGR